MNKLSNILEGKFYGKKKSTVKGIGNVKWGNGRLITVLNRMIRGDLI